MKRFINRFLMFGFLICGNAVAQTDLTGTWQGKLALDQNTKMTIQFILTKQANGSYRAVVNSLDTGGIKDVPATAVKFEGDKLIIDVANLSGSYSGTVAKGTITGEWKQQGSTFPLVLTPYKKPEAASLKGLLGEWVSKLKVTEEMTITVVFHFEYAKDGKFIATFDQPDQGVKGLAISDVLLEGDQVSFKIPIASGEYTGTLKNNSISGTYRVQTREYSMVLNKGKYQIPPIEMPAEDMNKLLGQWAGRIKIGEDEKVDVVTIILRFEKTKDGKLAAFTDSPEQGGYGYALTEVSLKGDLFKFKLPLTSGQFVGKLADDSISGTYTASGKQYELKVTKGAKFETPIPQVDIPAETMKKLMGRWTGKLSVLSVILRFERNAKGKDVITIDIPEQSVKNMPVLKASLVDGSLSLKIAGAEYRGKLNGNKIDGVFKTQGQDIPMPLTKE
jgi:hypothetical protein